MTTICKPLIAPIGQAEMRTLLDEEIDNFLADYQGIIDDPRTITTMADALLLAREINKLKSEKARRAELTRHEAEDVAYGADLARSDFSDLNAWHYDCHGYQMAGGAA